MNSESLATVIPRYYHQGMSTVVKRSVSLPEHLHQALEREAALGGIGFSGAIAEAAAQWLLLRRGLRAVAEWEAEHGALTAEELAAADELLDGAGESAVRLQAGPVAKATRPAAAAAVKKAPRKGIAQPATPAARGLPAKRSGTTGRPTRSAPRRSA
jgi:anti-sigma factor ChrR (cupin superfamily)